MNKYGNAFLKQIISDCIPEYITRNFSTLLDFTYKQIYKYKRVEQTAMLFQLNEIFTGEYIMFDL